MEAGPTRARYKIVRGALDLNGVAGRAVSRSKYGSECLPLPLLHTVRVIDG